MSTIDRYMIDSMMNASITQIIDPQKNRTNFANSAKRCENQSADYQKNCFSNIAMTKGQAALVVQGMTSNNIWSVYDQDEMIGFIGFVQLNSLGLCHHYEGTFDLEDPHPTHLANSEKAVSETLFWFLSGKTRTVYGLIDFLTWLRNNESRQIDFWAQSANERELDYLKSLGFICFGHLLPGLLRFKRSKVSSHH